MDTALVVLGFVVRLVLTWLVGEFLRSAFSGVAFGIIQRRFERGLSSSTRALIARRDQELAKSAHLSASVVSIPASPCQRSPRPYLIRSRTRRGR